MVAFNICILSTLLTIASAFLQPSIGNAPSRFASAARSKSSPLSQLVQISPTSIGNAIQTTNLHAASISEGTESSITESDDDDDEYEYEEYEFLTEQDFYGSEWKVGTVMDGKSKIKIDETWCRLVVKDGKFIAYWGDNREGKWNFDPASQFLSISKETFGGWFGKMIWAGTVEDFYFVEGTVRGWSPIAPASVIGQWQSKRLGVDPEEAGVAPWFETNDGDGDSDSGDAGDGSDDAVKALEDSKP